MNVIKESREQKLQRAYRIWYQCSIDSGSKSAQTINYHSNSSLQMDILAGRLHRHNRTWVEQVSIMNRILGSNMSSRSICWKLSSHWLDQSTIHLSVQSSTFEASFYNRLLPERHSMKRYSKVLQLLGNSPSHSRRECHRRVRCSNKTGSSLPMWFPCRLWPLMMLTRSPLCLLKFRHLWLSLSMKEIPK